MISNLFLLAPIVKNKGIDADLNISKLSSLFVLLICLGVSFIVKADIAKADHLVDHSVILNTDTHELDITAKLLIFDNTETQFSRELILAGQTKQYFTDISSDFVRSNKPDRDIWLNFQLVSKANHATHWFLTIGQSYFEYLYVYFVNQQGEVVNSFSNFKDKQVDEISYPNHSFDFLLAEGQDYEVFINISSLAKIVSKITISSPSAFTRDAITTSLLEGGFFGALLIIFIYNLFVFLNSRDRVHIYYAGYVLMCGVCFLGIDTLAKQFLGADSFLNSDFAQASSSMLMFVFYLLFLQEHLSIYSEFPAAKRLYILYFIFIFFAIFLCAFVENYLLFITTYLALGFYSLLSFIPLFRLSIKGNINALVVLLAYFLPITFSSLFIVSDLGLMYMAQDDIGFLVKYACVLEFVILAFALANRFFKDRKSSYNFQREAIFNLQESERLKREFLATLSHEFRTPMNGVQGSLELISLSEPSVEIEKHVENARKSSKHMLSLIEDVLQFVEVDENPQLENIEFDLEDLLLELKAKYDERFKQKSVIFKISNIAVGKRYLADYKRIYLALKHLIDNGAKFTDKGSVELLVSDRYYGSRCELHFRIIDSGVGVPVHLQGDIFSFFRQGDGSSSRRFGGLGLGLTIAKKQINTLRGRLTFESVPNKGSTFIVAIPVNIISNSSKIEKYLVETTSDQRLRISERGQKHNPVLVVEDNELNQSVIKAMVQNLGYAVVLCSNGLEAFNWTEKNSASIILMDCQMPVMDGFEATKKIRHSENTNSELAIIAVTGNVSEPEIQQCYAAGMDEVLTKPIQKVEIKNILERWIES